MGGRATVSVKFILATLAHEYMPRPVASSRGGGNGRMAVNALYQADEHSSTKPKSGANGVPTIECGDGNRGS